MTKDNETNELETWQYIDQIKILILNSYEDLESIELIDIAAMAARKYEINSTDAYKYAKIAIKQITELLSLKRSSAIIKAVCERELLFLYAKNDHNIRLASDLLKDRDRLLGLYAPVFNANEINLAECSDEKLLYYQDTLFPNDEFR